MGIASQTARMLFKELKYRPLPKTIHLLGRQTIHFDFEKAIDLLQCEGIEPNHVEPQFDNFTLEGKRHINKYGSTCHIDDVTFFQMLGVETIHAIDHSDFEGADLIFNLNHELPTHLHSIADFIFDGSVMDNIFDPATALKNVSKLLKPKGRYIGINMVSNKNGAYVAFSPQYFFDYFALNNFDDVKIYVYDFYNYNPGYSWQEAHVYLFDPTSEVEDGCGIDVCGFNGSNGLVGCFILAEKGEHSSSDRYASQSIYRQKEEWSQFKNSLEKIKLSNRPNHEYGSISGFPPREIPGFIYVGALDSNGYCEIIPDDYPERFTYKPHLAYARGWDLQLELIKRYKNRFKSFLKI